MRFLLWPLGNVHRVDNYRPLDTMRSMLMLARKAETYDNGHNKPYKTLNTRHEHTY